MPTRSAALLALALLPQLSACRSAIHAFGASASSARATAETFFAAFVNRYTNVERSPGYDSARAVLARAALAPSRAFDDTLIWTAKTPSTRALLVSGTARTGRYLFQPQAAAAAPEAPGDARHSITLTRLSKDTYAWDTMVEFGIGRMRPAAVNAVLGALISAAEGRSETDLRAEYRSAFPRAAPVLSQLFTLDSLRPRALPDGSTELTATVSLALDRLHPTYPAFAQYLGRYLAPARYALVLRDAAGDRWLELSGANGATTLHFRGFHGHLLPVAPGSAPRAMPDTLSLDMDVALRVKVFHIAAHAMHTSFVITQTDHEDAWTIVARQEPAWELPLATQRLVRSSLRRPFEGPGVIFRLGVQDAAGSDDSGDAPPERQSLVTRYTHLTVQESAIVRFLGGLSSHAVSEFTQRSERQQDEFLRVLFTALAADAADVLGGKQSAADR